MPIDYPVDPTNNVDKQRWNNDRCRYECKELIDKVYAIKDLLGIRVIVSANVINHVILVSIWTIKFVSARKN